MTPTIGWLNSGEEVVDRFNSHLHADIQNLLPEAFGKIRLNGEQFTIVQVEFGRIVGNTTCVKTNPDDVIVYAQRPKRFGLTRFVKNRSAKPSNSVVCILKKAEDGNYYVLISAFVGERPEPEPWDRNKTEKSVEFWNIHALVWGSEPIIPGTETEVCPW